MEEKEDSVLNSRQAIYVRGNLGMVRDRVMDAIFGNFIDTLYRDLLDLKNAGLNVCEYLHHDPIGQYLGLFRTTLQFHGSHVGIVVKILRKFRTKECRGYVSEFSYENFSRHLNFFYPNDRGETSRFMNLENKKQTDRELIAKIKYALSIPDSNTYDETLKEHLILIRYLLGKGADLYWLTPRGRDLVFQDLESYYQGDLSMKDTADEKLEEIYQEYQEKRRLVSERVGDDLDAIILSYLGESALNQRSAVDDRGRVYLQEPKDPRPRFQYGKRRSR